MVNKKIISSNPNIVGLWTIPLNDVLEIFHRAGVNFPDWMDSDEDIVVTAKGDAHGITFIGRLANVEGPPDLRE